ncbi:MAG TPA: urease accessory UreF family protein [Steroidobacteraceae bacterium]|nr:urease accessory UreF family protein [Steroidobacteraceae bacterium]
MSRPRITRTRTRISTELPAPRAADAHASMQLLRLLHLASPALPIGAFHFSQGLEHAVEAGWVTDESSALEWIGGIGDASLATLDLPVLARLKAAWSSQDHGSVLRWNAFLIASRETEELRAEDRHLGAALLRVLVELELSTELFSANAAKSVVGVAHATAFAFAAASWRIDAEACLQTYAWAWIENQVLAAVKLVPLGQSAAQRMLHALSARIPPLVEQVQKLTDSDIGVTTALNAVASGRHETQYSRLFRS